MPKLSFTIRGKLLSGIMTLSLALSAVLGQDWSAPLPPELAWHGLSEKLIVSDDHPWITPAERSGLTSTPRYGETIAWLEKLAAASSQVKLVSLGKSPELRDIWLVVVTKEGVATVADLKANGRPTLLVQAGIHPGEIDGKDAGLMILRDLTIAGAHPGLLDSVNLLLIPILNVDGHERLAPFGRINQRGPVETGWRTTARNLNLNRDYAKLDTREMQLLVQALNQWDPDLYLDIHVTDGMDYQYDITFGYIGQHGLSPESARWLDEWFTPTVSAALKARGHIPGPLIFAIDNQNPQAGLLEWQATPRFSNGYGDVRHLPTVLVENHSLKPFRQRVLGTYVLLEASLRLLATQGDELQRAILADRTREPAMVPLDWRQTPGPSGKIEFLAIQWRTYRSAVSGQQQLRWTGEPITLQVPYRRFTEPAATARRPRAYWLPPAWNEVIDRLAMHGIYMDRMQRPREVEVEMMRFSSYQLADEAYEGHVRVTASGVVERRREIFPAGSVRIPTDQPLGDLAVMLLEPDSPDSYFQWGFFLEIFQSTEYVEQYVMIPLAQRMIDATPNLRARFRAKLADDSAFAADPEARLRWFYEMTPYHDPRYRLYPVGWER